MMYLISIIFLTIATALFTLTFFSRILKLYILFKSKNYSTPNVHNKVSDLPSVVIHIATRNENPEIVLKTLDSIDKLNYSNYKVIIVDNNTSDKKLWEPIKSFCTYKNEKFYFYHVDNLSGFKAGALNFALEKTEKSTNLICIMDADCIVDPEFLSKIIPLFNDPQISYVQTPLGSLSPPVEDKFRSRIFMVYHYFLSVYMPFSHTFQLTPFTGAMGIIRKNVIEEAGEWNGYYLTEDMEFSYRVLKNGGKSVFVNIEYGKSLLPPDLKNFRKQFSRWTFGNAQIFRDHFFQTNNLCKSEGRFRRMIYFTLPGLQINLYYLPFVFLGLSLYLIDFNNHLFTRFEWASYIIMLTFITEIAGDALVFYFVGNWGNFKGYVTFVNFLNWLGLSPTNSLSTYAVLGKATIPFKITSKEQNSNGEDFFLYEAVILFISFLTLFFGINKTHTIAPLINVLFINVFTIIPIYFNIKRSN